MFRNPFTTFVGSNYQEYNGGELFVPRGRVSVPMLQANSATPNLRPMNANPVPVTYARPNANVRLHNPVGLITPAGVVK